MRSSDDQDPYSSRHGGNARDRVEARRRDRRRPGDTPDHAQPGGRYLLVDGLRNGRLISLVLCAMSTLLLFGSLFSDRFRIADVRIEGAQLVDVDQLVSAIAINGQRIWLVEPAAVLARVQENPYIEAADLQLQLPATALIRITERQPDVRWSTNGTEYLVDSAGLIIGPAETVTEVGTLVVVDRTNLPVEARQQLDTDALALARELSLRLPAEFGMFPSEIGWEAGTGILIEMGDGRLIIFGQGQDLERKLAVLGYLQQDGTVYTVLDLRPTNPYYRTTPAEPAG